MPEQTPASGHRPMKLQVAPDVERYRVEAFRSVEAINERHFTADALEGSIKDLARYVVDLADYINLLHDVAHRAWHLLDESGEVEGTEDEFLHLRGEHDRLSDALDVLEANGWEAHSDE